MPSIMPKGIYTRKKPAPKIKTCIICGEIFTSKYKTSKKRWAARKYCGYKCRGIARLGSHHSKESKEKISKSKKGRKQSISERNMRYKISRKGAESNLWCGGKSKTYKYRHTTGFAFKKWREAVFKRDNWTCQQCSKRSESGSQVYLEAHHIKTWIEYPDLRYTVSNGQTLCRKCHNLTKRGRRKIA